MHLSTMGTLLGYSLAQVDASVPAWLAPAAAGAAVLLGLVLVGLQLWQRHRKTRTAPAKATRPVSPGSVEFEEFSRDATQVVDRLAALLDAKADRIERLLDEADRRIQTMERAAGSQARREEFTEGARRAIRPQGQSRNGDELSAGDAVLHDRILQLSGRGLRPVEIAKQLHQPIGQIELVIALNRGTARL